MLETRKGGVALLVSLALTVPAVAQKIGSRFNVTSTGYLTNADAAFAPNGAVYMAVWTRSIGSNVQVKARRVSHTGALLGSELNITSGLGTRANAKIAYVAKTKRFLVTWQYRSGTGDWNVYGRTVQPTGAMSATAKLIDDAKRPLEVDLAGDLGDTEHHAILAWRSNGAGIRTTEITVPSTGAPSASAVDGVITTDLNDRQPTISRTGGSQRRYVLAWRRNQGTADNIYARALTDDGFATGKELGIATGVHNDTTPSIDGDGERFLLVWQRMKLGASHWDVMARMVGHNGSKVVVYSSVFNVSSGTRQERSPTVAYLRTKFAVAWSHSTGVSLKDDIKFRMFCPKTATHCGEVFDLSGTHDYDTFPVLAPRTSGGSGVDEAILMWASSDVLTNKRVLDAHLIEGIGDGGSLVNIGGGCGLGGAASKDGAFAIGNPSFKVRLNGASPRSKLALFNLTTQGPPLLGCGGCRITNPLILLPTGVSGGNATVPLGIPCQTSLIGVGVQMQFYVLGSGTSPCAGIEGISFSNRLSGTVGQ